MNKTLLKQGILKHQSITCYVSGKKKTIFPDQSNSGPRRLWITIWWVIFNLGLIWMCINPILLVPPSIWKLQDIWIRENGKYPHWVRNCHFGGTNINYTTGQCWMGFIRGPLIWRSKKVSFCKTVNNHFKTPTNPNSSNHFYGIWKFESNRWSFSLNRSYSYKIISKFTNLFPQNSSTHWM